MFDGGLAYFEHSAQNEIKCTGKIKSQKSFVQINIVSAVFVEPCRLSGSNVAMLQ